MQKVFRTKSFVRTRPTIVARGRVSTRRIILIMNSSETTESEEAIYRSVATGNKNISINEFLDQSKSANTKKSTIAIKKMFNSTMDSLNNADKSTQFKYLDELSLDELPDSLSRFFMVVSKEKGGSFNASSLNTHYLSMVRYLKLRDNFPVDITKDVRFAKVKEVLKARCVESVKDGKGGGINASQSLSADELKKIMASEGMSRENPRGLITLCHYYIMTGMGARARQECRDMNNSDLIFGPDSNVEGYPQFISLNERLTKTRRGGKGEQRELPGRVFLDSEYPELCPVRALVLYQSKKTKEQRAPDYPFFLTVKQSAQKNPGAEMFWYSSHPMGVNYIGALFQNAVKFSGLDLGGKKITATSARKNLAQVGASANVPSALLSKILGQKDLDSKVHYVENTEDIQRAASLVISRGVQGSDKQDFNSVYKDVKTSNTGSVTDENVPHVEVEQEPPKQRVQTEPPKQPVQTEPPKQPVQAVEQYNGPPHQVYHQDPQNYGHGAQVYHQDPQNYGHGAYQPPPPPPPPSFSYYQQPPPPQHFNYQPYYGYGYPAYPPYFPPYQPNYGPPPPPPTYYQPPPPPQQYSQPQNQFSLHQYNNYSFQGNQVPDLTQVNNEKRILTDISNNTFTFKKPKLL